MDSKWTMRFGHLTAKTRYPGVLRRKEGGYLIRGRATDPRTGQLKEVRRVIEVPGEAEASRILEDELDKVRAGGVEEKQKIPTFKSYSVSWLERRINRGRVQSAATRRIYGMTFQHHLYPTFGRIVLDQIRRADVESWLDDMGRQIKAGTLSPRTANFRLGLLSVLLRSAGQDYGIPSPADGADRFSVAEHPTYTPEEPNSLTAEEVPAFLIACRKVRPHLFALVCLGYSTGLRPSSLRPLRRCGASPDLVFLPDGTAWLHIRRSHTLGEEVMQSTKTKKYGLIRLPPDLVDILRWHIDRLNPIQAAGDLLFPNKAGGLYAPGKLWDAWGPIAKEAKIDKHLTPRAMRRTFQDLCRVAQVHDFVTRSISGHATETMQHHYSTITGGEQEQALAKVIDIMKAKQAFGGAATGGAVAIERLEASASDDSAAAG